MSQTSYAWGPFLLFALVGSVTPGPNVVMLASSGTSFGYRRTVPHLLGICFGFPLMLVLVQLGAGVVLKQVPWLLELLTALSLAYIAQLSWRIWRQADAVSLESPGSARPMRFGEAVLFQWVNGKAWQMALTVATIYGSPDDETRWLGAAAFWVILFGVGSLWVEAGKRLARWLERPRWRRIYYAALALSLMASTWPSGIASLLKLNTTS